MKGYTFDEIKQAYSALGISRGKTVLVKTDLRYLGPYAVPKKGEILKAHFEALSELVDLGEGTIVVQTNSTNICNTDIPYDKATTPSMRGVLTEYIRKQDGALRSWHPFMSYAAIGADAEYICENVSRHSFGLETPKARLLDKDAICLSIGLEPRKTCTYVHHMEMLMGVPYRYTKEFLHPIVQPDGSIEKELFYMFVWYRGMDLNRDGNVKLMKYCREHGMEFREADLGRGKVYAYNCNEFCRHVSGFLREDIYGWTSEPPTTRPYIK